MHSSDVDEFSDLVAGIYDAAIDTSLWVGVLERIATFVQGSTAGLLSKNAISQESDVHYSFGVEERYLQSYRETYWRFDPLAPLTFSEVGEVSSRSDFVSEAEFLEGRFYREWVKPQGWIDAANVVLDRQADSFALLSVIRSEAQGLVDEEIRHRIGLLVPHLRRSVLIAHLLDRAERRSATLEELIDTLSAGVFLLDAGGALVHSNRAGRQMLDQGKPVRPAARGLTATSRAAAKDLAAAITAAAKGDEAMGLLGMASPLLEEDGTTFVAHVLPMGAGGSRGRVGSGVAVALFVQQATVSRPAIPKVIANAYGLTPAELRVLLQTSEVSGIVDLAHALGVSEATVKTHLNRLYAKTGLSRQAELVRLVAGFSASLAHRRAA